MASKMFFRVRFREMWHHCAGHGIAGTGEGIDGTEQGIIQVEQGNKSNRAGHDAILYVMQYNKNYVFRIRRVEETMLTLLVQICRHFPKVELLYTLGQI